MILVGYFEWKLHDGQPMNQLKGIIANQIKIELNKINSIRI